MSNRPSRTSRTSPRQSDHEHHADEVMRQLQQVYKTWILPYSKVIAVAIIALLAGVFVLQSMAASRTESVGKAFAALADAEDPDAYVTVAADHPDTAAVPRAYLQAARALYDEGKYDQAATKFSLAHQASAGTDLEVVARLGEAYALEADGRADVARERFSSVAERATLNAIAIDAWIGAGRCAKLQGMLAEAEKLYGRARDLAADDPFAQQRIDNAMNALKAARYGSRPEPAQDEDAEAAGTAQQTGESKE